MSMLMVPLDPATVVVAVDPGKVMNRVWVSDGTGWLEQPVSVPVSCAGVEQVQRLISAHPSVLAPVIAVESTGSLHQAFVADLERRFPGSTRLFAPSETKAARTQLGSGRFKTDDRDCAALRYLARQGAGRPHAEESPIDTLRAAVRHRRGLVGDRKVAQQRLHDQLNSLSPGLSAPAGHGRALAIESSTGHAVGRPRPGQVDRLGPVDTTYSFPSGHTLNTTVFLVLMVWLVWPAVSAVVRGALVVTASALVIGVGWSRVYLGYHWLTDVSASALVAVAWLSVVWVLREPIAGALAHMGTRGEPDGRRRPEVRL